MTRSTRCASSSFLGLLLLTSAATAQITAPPEIVRGAVPKGHVHNMPTGHNSLASTGDGSVASLIYEDKGGDTLGVLRLAISADTGRTFKAFYTLPGSDAKHRHDPDSGVMCAGRQCDVLHVAWSVAITSDAGYRTAYYQSFNLTTRKWVGKAVVLGAGDANKKVDVMTHDISVTPFDTLAIAFGVGANGGLAMSAFDSALVIKKKGASAFSKMQPMRSSGLGWSRDPSIVDVDHEIHCCFKNLKGSGGIAYRAFDTVTMKWLQTAPVMVGPNSNGTGTTSGINAGNHSVIARDTKENLYILYVTGSAGGVTKNNKMRMAYAAAGKGSKNSDWTDLEVLAHTTTVGKNPRKVAKTNPSYPTLQGGDTSYNNYTLAPGYQGTMVVAYSKPWEDFQNEYVQIWQYGKNQPVPTKEINFWPDLEPFVFERLCGMRNTGSVGQAVWNVYGTNDHPPAKHKPFAPNGAVRLWALTYQSGRSISFGTGCSGNLKQVPRMSGNDEFPLIGKKYFVDFDRFPPNAFFFLAVGFKCQTFDMTPMGAAGCELNIDFPLIASLQVNAVGNLQLKWDIPNDSKLLGLHVLTQSFVIHPTVNAAKAITSNALRTVITL